MSHMIGVIVEHRENVQEVTIVRKQLEITNVYSVFVKHVSMTTVL